MSTFGNESTSFRGRKFWSKTEPKSINRVHSTAMWQVLEIHGQNPFHFPGQRWDLTWSDHIKTVSSQNVVQPVAKWSWIGSENHRKAMNYAWQVLFPPPSVAIADLNDASSNFIITLSAMELSAFVRWGSWTIAEIVPSSTSYGWGMPMYAPQLWPFHQF